VGCGNFGVDGGLTYGSFSGVNSIGVCAGGGGRMGV
jgi:hypothetical protein